MDAIAVEGLEKRYGKVQALAGVSFSVREGEIFGLLGPNGDLLFIPNGVVSQELPEPAAAS